MLSQREIGPKDTVQLFGQIKKGKIKLLSTKSNQSSYITLVLCWKRGVLDINTLKEERADLHDFSLAHGTLPEVGGVKGHTRTGE